MPRRDDAPRDLLFGLLALQNGMVTRDQLVLAFGAWSGAAGKPLSDLLAKQGALRPEHRPLLDALAEAHLKLHGGDPEKSLAALDVNRSTRESLAEAGGPEVEATLAHVGSGSNEPNADHDRTMTLSVGTATSDGQRFRVLRPHARGGLGAVFVAFDAELNREVALKQILDHHADDPTSRQRFVLKAEITGGLEHPGIVPVYGLGHYDGGRPYYAMRFIRGDSLKYAINRFHTDRSLKRDHGRRSLELRKLLRRFVDVCNAIGYAHTRGVLHRDIKPGNVIVGKHGETLVVDWGVAKALGKADPTAAVEERILIPSSASGTAETLPGSALGTPAYMSPEQAVGDPDRLGPRSDVYSLGATLYCLLTGNAPFDGDATVVLQAVGRGAFRPPRALDPSIDRPLEAVCLKAMATRPEDRYGSCRALAEDVERWMADEPVTAWHEPWTRTLVRWLTRHRTGVTLVAAAGLAAVVGLVAVLAVQASANAELTRSKAAVQARYDLAVDAIRTFHTGVSEDFLLREEKFKVLRDRLLKSASDFYGRLGSLLGKETDLVSRRALTAANFEMADLTEKVGPKEAALEAHLQVLASREALASEPGVDLETKVDVGRSLTAVALILEETGKLDEAVATYRKAESSLAALVGSATASPVRAALAVCRSRLGYVLHATGHAADGLSVLRPAKADQEVLAGAAGATNESQVELVRTINRIGAVLVALGHWSEAEAEYRLALRLQQKLVDDNPAVPEYRNVLAICHLGLGSLLLPMGKSSEAEAEYRLALSLQQELVDENPAVAAFRNPQAVSHMNLGSLLSQAGKPSEAEAEYRLALALQQTLVEDNPTVPDFRSHLAICHRALGGLLVAMGHWLEAEAEYRLALRHQQKLVKDNPTVPDFRSHLAMCHLGLGSLMLATGKPEAEAEHRLALTLQQELVADNHAVPDFRSHLATCHLGLASLLSAKGKPSEAEADYQRALTLQRKLVDENPDATNYRCDLASSLSRMGKFQRSEGRTSEAVLSFRSAVALLMERFPTLAADRLYDLACYQALLAGVAAEPGSGLSADEARVEADQAMDRLRRAVSAGYRNLAGMQIDTDLDALRGREDFRLLMMDLAMPAAPFAAAH